MAQHPRLLHILLGHRVFWEGWPVSMTMDCDQGLGPGPDGSLSPPSKNTWCEEALTLFQVPGENDPQCQ